MSSQKASAIQEASAKSPTRARGEARVATLLAAAAEVFSEKGFDGATMTEIAARAKAPIGSLYQFFPSKELISNALLAQGSEALSAMLTGLLQGAETLSASQMADTLFSKLFVALQDHSAFVALSDGRAEAPHKQAMRAKMRDQISDLFTAVSPPLPAGKPEVIAVLALHMMKLAVVLMREPDIDMRDAALNELREMLRNHLSS